MELSTFDFRSINQTESDYTEIDGCVTRSCNEQSLEVWGEDISEHYLITVRTDQQPLIDYVLLS